MRAGRIASVVALACAMGAGGFGLACEAGAGAGADAGAGASANANADASANADANASANANANANADLAEECVTCHMPEYRATKHPPHAGVKPTTCGVCHTQDGWSPSVLVHEWPLTGAHVKLDCFACHKGTPTVFRGTPGKCVGCHRDDFDRSDFPGHADFPTTCADCHTTTKWKPATKPSQHAVTPPAATASAAGSTDGGAHVPPPATTAHATATATHTGTAPTSTAPVPVPVPTPTTPAPPAPPARPHPEAAFAIKSGNHAGIDCQQCHSLGGVNSKANTSCVHCHARTKYDGKHTRVRSYPQGAAPANFCVGCHTGGTRSHT